VSTTKIAAMLTPEQLYLWHGFFDELDKLAQDGRAKKVVDFQGLKVHIDRPKGFKMEGVDDKGVPWTRIYSTDYGYLRGSQGGDGDSLDVFVGPNKKSSRVFWARQVRPDGSFDEYKVFLGYPDKASATKVYKEHIPSKLLSGMFEVSLDILKALLGVVPDGKKKVAGVQVMKKDQYYPTAFKVKAKEMRDMQRAMKGSGFRMAGGGPLSSGWSAGLSGPIAPQATIANPYPTMASHMGAAGSISPETMAALGAYGLV